MKAMVTLTKALCKKWIKALRSGKYKQGRNRLKYGNQNGTLYCCLGVAEEVCGLPRKDRSGLLHEAIKGFTFHQECSLVDMNDGEGNYAGNRQNFNQIAKYIEDEILPECPDE